MHEINSNCIFHVQVILENHARGDDYECPFARTSIALTKMLCDVLEINAEPRKFKCQTSYSLMLVNAVFVFGCTQATLEGEGDRGRGERGEGRGERGGGRGEGGEGRAEGRGREEGGGERGEEVRGEGREGRKGGKEEGRRRMGRASKGSVSRYLLPNPANLSPFQEIKIRNFFRLPVKADKIV